MTSDFARDEIEGAAGQLMLETQGEAGAALKRQTLDAMASSAPEGEEFSLFQYVLFFPDPQTGRPGETPERGGFRKLIGLIALYPSTVVLGWQKGTFRVKGGFVERLDRGGITCEAFDYGGNRYGVDLTTAQGRVISIAYDPDVAQAQGMRDDLEAEFPKTPA